MKTSDNREFDHVAEHYQDLLNPAICLSGEKTEFFAEYKVRDAIEYIVKLGAGTRPTILDFGSGIGESTMYFQTYLPGGRLISLDVSHKSLTLAKEKYSNRLEFVCYDGFAIPFKDDAFDVVFTACVFHHIPPAQRLNILQSIRRILKPGGLFIAFEHNPYNFLSVKAVKNCPFDENAVLIKGSEFLKLLQQAEYSQIGLKYRIFFPAFLKHLRPLEKILTWLPFGAQYLVYGII